MTYDPKFNLFGDSTGFEDPDTFYKLFLLFRALHASEDVEEPVDTLVVHGYKDCHLRCKYCVSDVKQWGHTKVKIEDIRRIVAENPIRIVHFVGGEPSYHWDHILRTLDEVPSVTQVSLTTNGLGLTQQRVTELRDRCKNTYYQLSLEPTGWGQRVFPDGTHQNVALKRVLDNLDTSILLDHPKSVINIVLPIGYNRQVQIPSWTVDDVIKELSLLVRSDTWKGRWAIEGKLIGYPLTPLPTSISDRVVEEHKLLTTSRQANVRYQQGLFSWTLTDLVRSVRHTRYPGKFSQCVLGGSTIHLSHTGYVYACSAKAGRGDPADPKYPGDCVSLNNYTKALRWTAACAPLPGLGELSCKSCSARYWCGKTCCDVATAACDYTRLIAKYAPDVLRIYDPEGFRLMRDGQEKLLRIYHENLPLLRSMIESPVVTRIINGLASHEETLAPREALKGLLI